jgi:hypothetical protein
MKLINCVLALALVLACLIGCKSGKTSTSGAGNNESPKNSYSSYTNTGASHSPDIS